MENRKPRLFAAALALLAVISILGSIGALAHTKPELVAARNVH